MQAELSNKPDSLANLEAARATAHSYEAAMRQRANEFLKKEGVHQNPPPSPKAGQLYDPL